MAIGGHALLFSRDIGNGDALRAQAIGEAHMPFPAHCGASDRRLVDDVPGWYFYGVEMVIHAGVQA